MPDIDPVLLEWTDLCVLVAKRAGLEGFTYWAFAVGSEGTVQERLIRGRTAWVRAAEAWTTPADEH